MLDRIKTLEDELSTLKQEAKAAALTQIEAALSTLTSLGYHYHLSQEQYAKNATTKKETKGGACPICNFTTNPPHDRRHHRSNPEPFTDDDLRERGMTRI